MNKQLIRVFLFILLAVTSCGESNISYYVFNGFIQGTTYRIVYGTAVESDIEEMRTNVEGILHGFDMSLSLYEDSSVVSRINRNEIVVLDPYFTEIFFLSKEMWTLTGGSFDITVGPMVKAWGFGPDAVRNFDESKRDSLIKLVGMDKVDIREGLLLKDDPRINLDFNAIAQGYSADVLSRFFDSLGIEHYLIEIGGEVRVKGERDNREWRIGIDRPEENNMFPGEDLQAVISMKDRSLATSGNYRKFYVEDGIKYSHTIDPTTGYPARNQLLSATILADECAVADAVATACMVMGKEKAMEFLEKYTEFDGYLIYSDDEGNFRTWTTESLERSVSESY